ncbi:MAG: ABC transporter permease [Ferruginibacter sp.]|nr:ABC transporter permease [Ferruginibacter sp.]
MNNTKHTGKTIWKKLCRKKSGIVGLCIIVLAVLVSFFGYIIAPDDSTDADLQTIEIQSKPLGYTQLFLKIPINNKTQSSFFYNLFFGRSTTHKFLPIKSFTINGQNISVNKYVDDDTSVVQNYSIVEITNKQPEKILTQIITKKYWLGTDAFGRDLLSRLIIGTRVSMMVGLVAVIISLSIGVLLGAFAGYYKGKTDTFIMWFINVTWSIPTLLLVFAITLALGKGFWQIFIAVGLTLWVSVARLVRGQVMAVKELEYVQAAKALGFKDFRIIFKHILPNIIGPVLVIAAGNFATAIIVEAGLSFLGIGVQPPQPSWGLMIKENYNLIITNNAMQALIPGFAIMLLVLAFNLLGTALRDAVDVKDGIG